MKEESQPTGIEPGLEARIVALVLGEASDFERDELNRLIKERPELAAFQAEFQRVHGLLLDVATGESAAEGDDWKLSAERRDAVLAVIGGEAGQQPPQQVVSKKFVDQPGSRKRSFFWSFAKVAAVLCITGIFGSLAIPSLLDSDSVGSAGHRQLGLALHNYRSAEPSQGRYDRQFFADDASGTKAFLLDGAASMAADEELFLAEPQAEMESYGESSRSALSDIRDSLASNAASPGGNTLPAPYYMEDDVQYYPTPPTVQPPQDTPASGENRTAERHSRSGQEYGNGSQPAGQPAAPGDRQSAWSYRYSRDGGLPANSQPAAPQAIDGKASPQHLWGAFGSATAGQVVDDIGQVADDMLSLPMNVDSRGEVDAAEPAISSASTGNGPDAGAMAMGEVRRLPPGGYGLPLDVAAEAQLDGGGSETADQGQDASNQPMSMLGPGTRPAKKKESESAFDFPSLDFQSQEQNSRWHVAQGQPQRRIEMATPQLLIGPEEEALTELDENGDGSEASGGRMGGGGFGGGGHGFGGMAMAEGRNKEIPAAPQSEEFLRRELDSWADQAESGKHSVTAGDADFVRDESRASGGDGEANYSVMVPDAAFGPHYSELQKGLAKSEDAPGHDYDKNDEAYWQRIPSQRYEGRGEWQKQFDQVAGSGQRRWREYVPPMLEGEFESKTRTRTTKSAAPAGLNEKTAENEAFSTFSLHVSDVSFKLARTALSQGHWPEAAKVRIEEFVNAFDYGDPMPSQSEKVACRVEQSIHPFLQQRNLLRVSMRTAAAGRSSNTPLRLTLLLDNSGSMERIDRQQTLRRAFALLAGQLKPIDQVTLISFARQPRLMADKVSGAQAQQLVQAIEDLPSEGGTNIEAALRLAFEKAREHQVDGAQNRIVLLTDGAVNLGNANPESLSRMIASMRDAGIAFDAAGISAEGLNDEILEALTRQGDGRYYLLDSPEAADDGFVRQIAGALRPSAKNVKVQVEFNPKRVGRYKLLGFEKHRLKQEDFRNDKVDAAEMAAAEAGVAVYQFEAKPDGEGDVGLVSVRFRDLSTGQMVEQCWPIPYQADAPRLDQAAPPLRIAASAALLAAKLRGEPLGESVHLKTLSQLISTLPDQDRNASRVQQFQTMIQQARQLSGK